MAEKKKETSTTTTTVPASDADKAIADALAAAGVQTAAGPYQLPKDFKYPRRYVTMRGEGGDYSSVGNKWYYVGSKFVDENGKVARDAYDPATEVNMDRDWET